MKLPRTGEKTKAGREVKEETPPEPEPTINEQGKHYADEWRNQGIRRERESTSRSSLSSFWESSGQVNMEFHDSFYGRREAKGLN